MSIKNILNDIIANKNNGLEDFFERHNKIHPPFIYNSVDIRYSGFKIAPVDTNIFPAGFSLFSEAEIDYSAKELKNFIGKYHPFLQGKKILIVPENHTRNKYYLDNLANLKTICEKAGFETRIGGVKVKQEPQVIESQTKGTVRVERIIREGDKIYLPENSLNQAFHPDFIILNNDIPHGIADVLRNIEIPILPSPKYGWYNRTKSNYFDEYKKISEAFAKEFSIDDWLISAIHTQCGKINFKEREGLECVADKAFYALEKIKKKYKEYKIEQKPYLFIKSNKGTYGMGIITISNPKEIFEINKDERKSMVASKEGKAITEVVIQEGIPTVEKIDGKVAEPLMYLIGGKVVACNYRINTEKSDRVNLNSKGMGFAKVGADELCSVNSLIARLAVLGAQYEQYK